LIELMSIYGNPNIGVYLFANNHVAIAPPGITQRERRKIEDVLGVEVIETKIADMVINGVLLAGNDKGLLLPRIVKPEEYEYLKEQLSGRMKIVILNVKATALGNLIVANSRAALISRMIDPSAVPLIKEALGVEVVLRRELANIPTIGSMMVVTNKGGLVHPSVSEEELKILNNLFGVEFMTGTVNFGVYFVKAGIVANDKGVLVGDETTGPELMRIQQALRPEE